MSGPVVTDTPDARGAFALVRDRTFGPFFAARIASALGTWVHSIAAAIVVWQLTRSAFLVSLVSVAQSTPQLVLALWSGARADRRDRRRQIMAGWGIAALGSALLALAFVFMPIEGTRGAVVVIAATAISGVGLVLGLSPQQSVLPALARPQELSLVIALNSLPSTLARSIGPAIGAALVAFGSPAAAFAVAAAAALVFVGVLLPMRLPAMAVDVSTSGSVSEGLRWLRGHRSVRALLLGTVVIGMACDPVQTLTPAIAASHGQGESFVGVLASAFGVGAAAGLLGMRRIERRLGTPSLGFWALVVLSLGLAGTAVATVPAAVVVAMALAGAGMAIGLNAFTTMLHHAVPDSYRGRAMALWGVAYLGLRPITATFSGALADAISVEVSLLVVAGLVFAGTLAWDPRRVD